MPASVSLCEASWTESLFTGPECYFGLQISTSRNITVWSNPVWSRKPARKRLLPLNHQLRIPHKPPEPHCPPFADLPTINHILPGRIQELKLCSWVFGWWYQGDTWRFALLPGLVKLQEKRSPYAQDRSCDPCLKCQTEIHRPIL